MLSVLLSTVVCFGDLQWLGATRSPEAATLHTAARRYEKPGQPDIWLVGVAHLGDAGYYIALDELLKASDTVIFEAVMPAGATPPSGIDHASRAAATRASLRVIADMAAGQKVDSLEALAKALAMDHRPSANVLRRLEHDAWGNDVTLERGSSGLVVRSNGADGRPGGDGHAADVLVPVPDIEGADGGTLQRELATGLRLEFQLNSLPYESPNWVPGDMSAEELHERLTGDKAATNGEGEPTEFSGMLTGTSGVGQMAVGFIRMLPSIDRASGGRAIDGLRLIMIESLSNPDVVEQGTAVLGERFEQVILHDRNDVAVVHTMDQVDRHAEGDAVAVLYGAAHMPGINDAIVAKGWQPVETRWLDAIGVNLAASKLTAEDLAAVRQWSEQAGAMFGN